MIMFICNRHLKLVMFLVILSGCANAPDELSFNDRDPYEEFNRDIFAFNMKLDDYVVEPAAIGYRKLPQVNQDMLTNFVDWTTMPSTSLNSTFQGDAENAALGVLSFLVNGLTLGLADLTDDSDDPDHTDFDDTLHGYGVPQGQYIVLPLLGPGSTRSHSAWLVDSVTNPLGFASTPAASTINTVSTPVSVVTFRGNNYDLINDVKYGSLDPYSRTRSIYFQYDTNTPDDQSEDDAFDAFIQSQE
jgi:phospholipid-binding lipoprotein MlaA